MKNIDADETVFFVEDQGDSSVGLPPLSVVISFSYHIDKEQFEDYFASIKELVKNEDWHGNVSVGVYYKFGNELEPLPRLVLSNLMSDEPPVRVRFI